MNDEDFARNAFAAFRSGQTGEPPILPDVELLAQRGRRANRNRHGFYVAGTTVAAGVAVAGVVTGPALLGLGSTSSDVGTGAQGVTPPASPAPSPASHDAAEPSPGVACTTQPAINWASLVNAALPAGVTATVYQPAKCVQTSDGSRTIEALLQLSTGTVELQVNVATGPDIVAKLRRGPGSVVIWPASPAASTSLDPAALASLQASKIAAGAALGSGSAAGAAGAAPVSSPSPSLDPAALASLQAQKQAMASAGTTASPADGAGQGGGAKGGGVAGGDGSCSTVGPDETVCLSHLTKDQLSVVDAQLLRTSSAAVAVDVTASNGKGLAAAAPGQLPSDATMRAIAQAVAAHF